MSEKKDWVGKTFFLTIWDKSLQNMGIVPDWGNIETLKGNIETAVNELSKSFYGALCESKEGAKHIHLAISFEKAKRVNAVSKLLGNAHVEPMRGSKEQACDYIDKKGKFEEKGEKILAKFGAPDKVQDNSGKHLNADEVKRLIASGEINASNLDLYIMQNAETESQARNIEGLYNRYMLATAHQMRDIEVFYVEGTTGQGKTRGAYNRFTDIFKASVSDKTSFPFNGYHGERVLLLDELRPGVFRPAELFQILDRYPLTVDIKNGRFPAMWTTVIITSAMKLDDWFADENKGQDNNKAQFLRRIHHHMVAEGQEWHVYGANDEFMKIPQDEVIPF